MFIPLSKAALAASLLLLPHSIFANEIKLYAYNLGLKQDHSTAAFTGEKFPLPSESLWKVCYPEPPKNIPAGEDVDTAWQRYSEGSRMYLVFGLYECPVGYTNNFQVTTHDFGKWYDAEGAARQEERMFDTELLIKREDIEKHPEAAWYGVAKDLLEEVPEDERASLTHFRVGMAYTLHTAPLANDQNDEEDSVDNWNVDHSLTVTGNLEANANAPVTFTRAGGNTQQRRNKPIYFNPTHRLGRMSYMTLDENDEPDPQGFDIVDWVVDQKAIPDLNIYSCFFDAGMQAPLPWHRRQLRVVRSDDMILPTGCGRIVLTTSTTQLEHAIDLWNQRQLAWSRYRINMKTWPPLYESKYEIVENGIGRVPGIFSREDVGRTEDLADGDVKEVLPQSIKDEIAVINGMMDVLDLKEDYIPRPTSDYHFSEGSDDFGDDGDERQALDDGDEQWYRVQYAPGSASDDEAAEEEEEEEGSWMDDETQWGFPSPNSETEEAQEGTTFPPPNIGELAVDMNAIANDLQAPSPSIEGNKDAGVTEQQQQPQREHVRDFHPHGIVHHNQLEEQLTDLDSYVIALENILRNAITSSVSNKPDDHNNDENENMLARILTLGNPVDPQSPRTKLANWEKEVKEELERSDRKMFKVTGHKQDVGFNPDVEDGDDGLNGKREQLQELDEYEVEQDEGDVADGSGTGNFGPGKKRKQV